MSEPHKASARDIAIFCDQLMAKIPAGKKVMGNKGHHGKKAIISAPNSHDPQDLQHFKSQARARHKSFNARIKNFPWLTCHSAMASTSTELASRQHA
jgi:hypothetical protein